MAKVHPGGILIPTPFQLLVDKPIADYMVLEFTSDLDDLSILPHIFEGMVTFVIESQTLYVRTSTSWEPISGNAILQNLQSVLEQGSLASILQEFEIERLDANGDFASRISLTDSFTGIENIGEISILNKDEDGNIRSGIKASSVDSKLYLYGTLVDANGNPINTGGSQDLQETTANGATTNIPMTVNDGTDKLTHSAKALIYGKNGGGYTTSVEAEDAIGNFKAIIPTLNADKTFAFVEDLPAAQGLQSVTDVNNTTTNDVNVNKLGVYDPFNELHQVVFAVDGGVSFGDGVDDANSYFTVQPFGFGFGKDSDNKGVVFINDNLTSSRNYQLPDAEGTLALQESTTKNLHVSVTESTPITGVTTEQIAAFHTIPANATSAGILSIEADILKPLTNGACDIYIYKLANTSNLTGATKMATLIISSTTRYSRIERKRIKLTGTQASMIGSTVNTNTDTTNSGSNPTVITFDSTVDNIIGIVIKNGSASDATTVSNFNIKFDKAI